MSSTALRDDVISQRMFYGGFLGLPWLWIVHALHWYGKQRQVDQEALLDNEEGDENGENEGGPSAAEIAEQEGKWARRCRNFGVFFSFLWLLWILLVQLVLIDSLPMSWFIREPDQGEYTGW